MDFKLQPGETVKRARLHEDYGGRQQGGIGPSRQTPNIFLFSDPRSGHQYGYFDGWGDDGCYHYAGEGQQGDQTMTQGNLAILNHREDGRALRLLDGARGEVTYVGEFELAADNPWYLTDAPMRDSDEIRSVIMFRLTPVGGTQDKRPPLPQTPHDKSELIEVDVEQTHTERTYVNPSREPYQAERRESKLVQRYQRHLLLQGHTVARHKISPVKELKPLFSDLYDKTVHKLIEAKGTITREAVRMAVGQLLDYRRFIERDGQRPALAVLLPSRPRPDLLDYCADLGIEVIWEEGDSFTSTA
ncbi:restriction endonuclease [Nocardiopsis sp. CNT-189]|uniref:restriction endonuclease n=1 Tax=Nocardiopsis oceanisediminis TaxID=2816862 RepID=UPI003B35AF39